MNKCDITKFTDRTIRNGYVPVSPIELALYHIEDKINEIIDILNKE